MATITIRKDVNFKDIEELNKKILNNSNITLRLPNALNTSGIFGIEGLILQLIATWLRTEGSHILHTFVDDPSDVNQFSDMCNSLYGICALSLASEVLSAKKTEISRNFSLLLAADRIKKIREEHYSEAFKGFYVTIPSIKAPRNNSEFLSPFYNGESVVGRGKFLQITKDSLHAVIGDKKNYLSDSLTNNLSEIIRELFTNTHKHARKCANGNILEKNFRSVSFRMASVGADRLTTLSKAGGKNLVLAIGDWLPKGNKTISLLDITIVDSGPGFARRWTGLSSQALTFDNECNAVVDCFKKYNSSDNTESSGSGLSNVLRDLRKLEGWFKLRTGRTLIERSFYNKEGSLEVAAKDIQKKDVFVEGVVFNIIIPFLPSK